jgi:hypothetical protein
MYVCVYKNVCSVGTYIIYKYSKRLTWKKKSLPKSKWLRICVLFWNALKHTKYSENKYDKLEKRENKTRKKRSANTKYLNIEQIFRKKNSISCSFLLFCTMFKLEMCIHEFFFTSFLARRTKRKLTQRNHPILVWLNETTNNRYFVQHVRLYQLFNSSWWNMH